MAESEERYFNFPIQLLRGFFKEDNTVLRDIVDYCLFQHLTHHYSEGDNTQKLQDAAKYFKMRISGDLETRYERAEALYFSQPEKVVKVGLHLSIFWQYHDGHKTDFEKATLLAFLAIKSILGNKAYCKITNGFLLSRMDGQPSGMKNEELSPEIQFYATRYRLDKLKHELRLKWGLKVYGRYSRGFFVSFSLSMDDLVYQAERKRVSRLKKDLKDEQRESIKRAIRRLNNQ